MKSFIKRLSLFAAALSLALTLCLQAVDQREPPLGGAVFPSARYEKVTDGERYYYLRREGDTGPGLYYLSPEEYWKVYTEKGAEAAEPSDSLLESMSTAALLSSALNSWQVSAFSDLTLDTLSTLYAQSEQNSLVLKAFRKRPDAAETLLDYYLALGISDMKRAFPSDLYDMPMHILLRLRLIACQDYILDNLTVSERKRLLAKCASDAAYIKEFNDRLTEKNTRSASSGVFEPYTYFESYTLLIAGLILDRDVEKFSSYPAFQYDRTLSIHDPAYEIFERYHSFTTRLNYFSFENLFLYPSDNEKQMGLPAFFRAMLYAYLASNPAGSPYPDLYAPPLDDRGTKSVVYTPKGSPIVTRYREDADPAREERAKTAFAALLERFPTVAALPATVDTRYNSHSFAWCASEDYAFRTVDGSAVPAYFLDGSYELVAEGLARIPDNARPGDVVVYPGADGSPVHSALVCDPAENLLVSKWGEYGLVLHRLQDCPYAREGMTLRLYRLAAAEPETFLASADPVERAIFARLLR